MKIDFKPVNEFIGWGRAEEFVKQIIKENNINTILELGAGANPTINPLFIKNNKLSYTISDNNFDELAKADDIYAKEELDLNVERISHHAKYDFIFSRMVGEHIQNGDYFHQNIYSLLNPGGIAFHCFSTLYSFPFLINFLFPETVSDMLLNLFASRDKAKHGKFKAYYSWCRGPSDKMIERYESIGYDVVEYVGYYGHHYYEKIFLLNELEKIKTKILLKKKLPYLTSYAYVILKK
jgi:hypothetical protein